eukprot:764090-Hanusia_phi.AAC.3
MGATTERRFTRRKEESRALACFLTRPSRFIAKWQSKDQKLKDFLRAQRVPVNERDEIPLVCISSRPPATSSPSGSPASPSSESVDEDEATVVAVSPKYVAKFHSVPNGNGLTLSLRIM